MAENTNCEIKTMPQTPTGIGGGGSFLLSGGGGIYLFGFVFCRETLSFLQGPAKILNGNKRSIEMEVNLPKCTQLDQKC